MREAFPGASFEWWPANDGPPQSQLYRDAIASLAPGNIVMAAVPDQLHFDVGMAALEHHQHVCCVKPLVLRYSQAKEIERAAYDGGLMVGIEYHKRFDDRSLMARRKYRAGLLRRFPTRYRMPHGEVVLPAFKLSELVHRREFRRVCLYRLPLCRPGCVHHRSRTRGRSVYGIRDRYPNGNLGFLWTDARVIWNNGAALNVQNSLSFPDSAPGPNSQGLTMYCKGSDNGALLDHPTSTVD